MHNQSPSVISHAKRTWGDEEVLDLVVVNLQWDLQGVGQHWVGSVVAGSLGGGVNRVFLIIASTCLCERHVHIFNSVPSPPHLPFPCRVSPSPTDVCLGAGELLTTCD